MEIKINTADDEEPNCNRCDHCCEDDHYCSQLCGPMHGWNRYERTETMRCDHVEDIYRV